jgi:hypothetical protein
MTLVLNGTTGVSAVDGSASTPAFQGNDTNTGVFFPAADRIGFSTNGVQRGEFDSSGNFQFNSGYGSVATAYGCRAWVNFNGTGTVAIRASGNVSSITDNGTGNYTVNFTNAMSDANYSACSMGRLDTSSDDRIPDIGMRRGVAPTTSALRVQCTEGISTAFDCDFVTVAVFR